MCRILSTLPENEFDNFKAVGLLALGECEVPVQSVKLSNEEAMAVCTEDMPVLITRQQAKIFFGFKE